MLLKNNCAKQEVDREKGNKDQDQVLRSRRHGHGFGEPQHHSYIAFFFFVFISQTLFFLQLCTTSHPPSTISEAPRSYGSRRGEDDSPFPSRFPHRMVSLIKFILSLFFVILLSVSAANLDSDSPSPCYVYCLITSILC